MRKKLLKFNTFVLLTFSSMTSYADVVLNLTSIIDDTCVEPFPNAGTYTNAGLMNGKPYFSKGSNLRIIWSGSQWLIEGDDPLTPEVLWITGWFNNSNTPLPPESGWTSGIGCTTITLSGSETSMPCSISSTVSEINNVTCNGGNNGSATVVATGGSEPYSYTWLPSGGNNATATNLIAGNYTCNITDGLGCTISQDVTITQPPPISVFSTQTNVTCNGGNNGTITLNTSGGVGTTSYLWNDGSTEQNRYTLSAGIYYVTINDENGCNISLNIEILQPEPLINNPTINNISCYGLNNGSITLNPTGGTAPFTYLWSTEDTTSSINSLSQGSYSVTVSDSNGCIVTQNFDITEPELLSASAFVSKNISCMGNNDGQITINIVGGTKYWNYYYKLNGNYVSETNYVNNLTDTSFIYTIVDANMCTYTDSIVLTEPSIIPLSRVYVNAAATGANNGTDWSNAYTDLATALEQNRCSNEFWVAAGTYSPSYDKYYETPIDERNKTFYIKSGIKMYGGFAGTEESPSQRNIWTNVTTLDGNIGNNSSTTDNSLHVVHGYGKFYFDGFRVINGNASNGSGGGIYTEYADTSIVLNSIFEYNQAGIGGAYCTYNSDQCIVDKCIIRNNSGTGIVFDEGSTGYLTNSIIDSNTYGWGYRTGGAYFAGSGYIYNNVFANNISDYNGGAFGIGHGKIINNTFYNNRAAMASGAIHFWNSYVNLENNIFNKNTISLSDSTSFKADINTVFNDFLLSVKNNMFQSDASTYFFPTSEVSGNQYGIHPQFKNGTNIVGADNAYYTEDDGLRVLCTSPAFAAGITTSNMQPTDILSDQRDTIPTIGAYEEPVAVGPLPITEVNMSKTLCQSGTRNYQNCDHLIATIESTGNNPITGNTEVDCSFMGYTLYSIRSYVTRSFEITNLDPVIKPSSNIDLVPNDIVTTTTGTVTLYVLQKEFDSFNVYNEVKLPTSPTDVLGISNLLVENRSGSSSDGSGMPNTYPGSPININPDDYKILWDSVRGCYSITFDVTGFGGFWIKTQTDPLAIQLTNIAAINVGKSNHVTWTTSKEAEGDIFEIERSKNGREFIKIGNINAKSVDNSSYTFVDASPYEGISYYRLIMKNNDGSSYHSKVVNATMNNDKSGLIIMPNPADATINISGIDKYNLNKEISIVNTIGVKVLNQITIDTSMNLDISKLSKGVYIVLLADGSTAKFIKK